MKTIEKTSYYRIIDEQYFCCDELQFKHYCLTCDEFMGCYFCEFDYNEKHECEQHSCQTPLI